MIHKWTQTKIHSEKQNGNCFVTALACVTGIPPKDIPEFEDMPAGLWHMAFDDWLDTVGYEVGYSQAAPAGFALASGRSPRGDFKHMVVVKDGEFFHDPHPSGSYLESVDLFWQLREIKNDKP